jgi:hypothetical protein
MSELDPERIARLIESGLAATAESERLQYLKDAVRLITNAAAMASPEQQARFDELLIVVQSMIQERSSESAGI